MKVIAQPIDTMGWFVGKKDACSSCGLAIELTADDQKYVKEGSGYQDDGDLYLSWPCPNCKHANYVAGPNKYQLLKEAKERLENNGSTAHELYMNDRVWPYNER